MANYSTKARTHRKKESLSTKDAGSLLLLLSTWVCAGLMLATIALSVYYPQVYCYTTGIKWAAVYIAVYITWIAYDNSYFARKVIAVTANAAAFWSMTLLLTPIVFLIKGLTGVIVLYKKACSYFSTRVVWLCKRLR